MSAVWINQWKFIWIKIIFGVILVFLVHPQLTQTFFLRAADVNFTKEETTQILKEISEIILNETNAALPELQRKSVRKISERYPPDYYLDQLTRDYFEEYVDAWWNDSRGEEHSHVEQILNSSLLTNLDRHGIVAGHMFKYAAYVLERFGTYQEVGYTYKYRDNSDTEDDHLIVQMEIWNSSNVDEKMLFIIGYDDTPTVVTFAPNISEGLVALQVQAVQTDRNPFMDASANFLNSPVVMVNAIDQQTHLHLSHDQQVEIDMPWFTELGDKILGQQLTIEAREVWDYGDYPILSITVLPRTFMSVYIATDTPDLTISMVITNGFIPTPDLICNPPKREFLRPVCVSLDKTQYRFAITDFHPDPSHTSEGHMETYFIGIAPIPGNKSVSVGSLVNVTIAINRTNCLYWDENRNIWSESGCYITTIYAPEAYGAISCICPHLSTFSATEFTTPLFLVEHLKLENYFMIVLDNNVIIPYVVSGLLVLVGIFLIICWVADRKDSRNKGLHLLADPKLEMEQHFYLVTVVTGGYFSGSSTTSNISLQIYGTNGSCTPFVLREDVQAVKTMRSNSKDTFLVSSLKSLGELQKIRLWRDDNGKSPDWMCRAVSVRCIHSGRLYRFRIETNLSLGLFGRSTVLEVPVCKDQDLLKWTFCFSYCLYTGFHDRHPWLSIWKCSQSIRFTRCERLLCLVASVFLYVLFLYWYRDVYHHVERIETPEFRLDAYQLVVAFYVFCLATPAEFVLRQLFRATKLSQVLTLIAWHSREHFTLKNEHVFGTYDQFQPLHSELSPTFFTHQGGKPETTTNFSIPTNNAADTEKWLAHTPRPPTLSYKQPLPNSFIRDTDQGRSRSQRKPLESRPPRREPPRPKPNLEKSASTLGSSTTTGSSSTSTATTDSGTQSMSTLTSSESTIGGDAKKIPLFHPQNEMASRIEPSLPPVRVVKVLTSGKDKPVVRIILCWQTPAPTFCKFLPSCFVFIGWMVGLSFIGGATAVIVIFGIQLGPMLLWELLSDLIITLVFSAFIFYPLLIFVIAIVQSSFLWVADFEQDDRFQVKILQDKEPKLDHCKPCAYQLFVPERVHPPITEKRSFEKKLEASRKDQANFRLLLVVVHCILMALLIAIPYLNFSQYDYQQTSSLKGIFEEQHHWKKIHNIESYYEYLHEFLENVIFPQTYDHGEYIPYFDSVPVYLSDQVSLLVGVPRLRQFRDSPKKNCTTSSNFPLPCLHSELMELIYPLDRESYGGNWLSRFTSPGSGSTFDYNDIWKYVEDSESLTRGAKILCYPPGGYLAYLGRNMMRSFGVLEYLGAHDWIDNRTRAILLEISTFNPSVNLYVYTQLIAEISCSGSWLLSSVYYPVTLTNVNSTANDNDSYFVFYILLVLILVVLTVKGSLQVVGWFKYRKVLPTEVILVLMTLTSVSIGFHRLRLVQDLEERLDKALINDHVPFDNVCHWDQWERHCFAFTFSFAVLMILQYMFKTRPEFYMLHVSLKLSSGYLVSHGFYMILLLMCFCMWGYVLFGEHTSLFRTIPACFTTILQEIVGDYFWEDLLELNYFWSQIYDIIFDVSAVFIGVNLMISILDDSFQDARRIASQKKYWISYLQFARRFLPQSHIVGPFKGPILHPARIAAMQNTSAEFLRECFETEELQRMQLMYQLTQTLANERGFYLVSSNWKRKKARERRELALKIEMMRRRVIRFISTKWHSVLTPDEVREHSQFSQNILRLKLRKLEQKFERLEQALAKLNKGPYTQVTF